MPAVGRIISCVCNFVCVCVCVSVSVCLALQKENSTKVGVVLRSPSLAGKSMHLGNELF